MGRCVYYLWNIAFRVAEKSHDRFTPEYRFNNISRSLSRFSPFEDLLV